MKVIELLDKIAKGEEVPKKIKYDTIYYYFRNYDYKEYEMLEDYIDEQSSFIEKIDFYKLNDEIEIIEEEKEIKKLNAKYTSQIGKLELANKIDEIIDELNKIKKEGK